MNRFALYTITIAFTGCAVAAEVSVQMQDLPPAVQAAVKRETTNVTLVGLSKEVEDGETSYEVETKVNGHTRDLLLNGSGKVVEVEEEIGLERLPDAARQALQKAATRGTITRVEAVTRGASVSYEAVIRKNGRNSEVAVNADGSAHN